MLSYRECFAHPGVARVFAAAALSRVTTSMFGLSVLLAVLRLTDSYSAAGTVMTCHAFSLAIFVPVSGRLADRFGARRVLLATIGLHAASYLFLLVALHSAAAMPVIALAAILTGASTPPAAPVTRGMWPALVAREQLRAAYAMDAALNAAMFVVGPVLVGAVTLVLSPLAAVAAAGIAKISGDALLATSPALSRMPRSEARDGRRFLGPLAQGQVVLLLAIMALDTFVFGALQVASAAVAKGGSAAGWLNSAVAIGEVAGGLAFGARVWPGSTRTQLVTLHLGTAVVLASAAAAGGFVVLSLIYVVAGLLGGARDSLDQVALGEAAPEGYRTEAFAWLATFMWGGFGVGTFVSGHLQVASGTAAVYLAAAASGVLAALGATRLAGGSLSRGT